MIGNALIITIALLLALVFWLMGELKFSAPYELVLWREYATPILTYVALLSVNVFAAAFVFIRKFFLKDTPGENSPISTNSFTRVGPRCPHLGLKRRPTEMALGYEPEEFIGPRQVYEIRGRTYRLWTSEIATMVEVGKFRVIGQEDLTEFAYGSDKGRMKSDVENLIRQGLVQMKSIPHEEKGSRQLLTLTKSGHRLLTENRSAGKDQALYCGFAKPREAHHDADLYRLYQKAADKIECGGGRNLRVVLDYELKKRVYHELAKLGPDRASSESKRTVAERHGLQVARGKILLPDVRIEYDTPEGERARVDIELVTSHYRGRHLAEKVHAGFSTYAHANDMSNLRRVLDQRELTAEILSL